MNSSVYVSMLNVLSMKYEIDVPEQAPKTIKSKAVMRNGFLDDRYHIYYFCFNRVYTVI